MTELAPDEEPPKKKIPIDVPGLKRLALSFVDYACARLDGTPAQRLSAERSLSRAFRFGKEYHFTEELIARAAEHGVTLKESP